MRMVIFSSGGGKGFSGKEAAAIAAGIAAFGAFVVSGIKNMWNEAVREAEKKHTNR